MEKEKTELDKEALRPVLKDQYHQDSLFGNSFQSKSFFIVHPEWLSEVVDNNEPEPLRRPPWPWEQPRYRQNIQLPITYKVVETEESKPEIDARAQNGDTTLADGSTVPYALPVRYMFTHPSIDDTKPSVKQTHFGAPIVDTSTYRLSY
ncbi:uncharacterized protein LOC127844864 isoform X2 [Dreissena polymorpha]|uniref:uncharacterized protein LOC127844864 isoform X2 n=1 Tax=Dreissena polymorpha TaxID=45954 RepID=UPI0022655D65|nr:uncharacterized protein LOC127844864 isoform X2 [Dreissena polymorpha]